MVPLDFAGVDLHGQIQIIVAELIAGASAVWILDWPGYRKVNVNTVPLRKVGSA